jgi:ADP-heptose:LPS heptosyltransferase
MSGSAGDPVLVHLASGIGNIVLATPLLHVLQRNGFVVDVLLDADYHGVGALFEDWSAVRNVYVGRSGAPELRSYGHVMAAVPPFYWRRFRSRYDGVNIYRPPDVLFYGNEQAYYLEFARSLGCDITDAPYYFLPLGERRPRDTIALAPGSKPAEMAAKRWPLFVELAERLDDVAIVGTPNDLLRFDGSQMCFPGHVRSFIGRLSLKETAAVLAGAAVVVANDCGLGHLAGALGVPTILLFGPTPHYTLGPLPPNVMVLRTGLHCEPCWFRAALHACARRVDCLRQLDVEEVLHAIRESEGNR